MNFPLFARTGLVVAGLFSSMLVYCQSPVVTHARSKHRMGNTESRVAIFINPLSPLELQEGAAGLGVNIKLAPRWDISAEADYLFEGAGQGLDDYAIKGGVRGILTLKRLSRSRIFFYGIDARVKYYSFTDKANFINAATVDTLYNYSHVATNTLFGAAAIVGVRLPISKNRKWALELNTGLGVKYRTVNRKNIPAGYKYFQDDTFIRKDPNITANQDYSSWDNPYVPSAIKLMFFF